MATKDRCFTVRMTSRVRYLLGILFPEGIPRSDNRDPIDRFVGHKLINAACLAVPALENGLLSNATSIQEGCHDAIINVLSELCLKAQEFSVEYAVIKGIAFERCIYGNLHMRDAGDIDLLVAPGTEHAVESAILSLGYRQAGGPSSVSAGISGHAIAAVRAAQMGYGGDGRIVKRRPNSREFEPFVKPGYPTIEVHDSFAKLPAWFLEGMVRRAYSNELRLASDPLDVLVMLVVNTYENSESFFANCFDGGPVLRDYLDLAAFFTAHSEDTDWMEVSKLIRELDLEEEAGVVLGNLERLFGADVTCGCLMSIVRKDSRWDVGIVERSLDDKVARISAVSGFREELRMRASDCPIDVVPIDGSQDAVLHSEDLVQCLLRKEGEKALAAELVVPSGLLNDGILLQCCLYPLEGLCDYVAYKIDVGIYGEEICSYGRCAQRLISDAAIKKKAGRGLPIACLRSRGLERFRVCLPSGISEEILDGRTFALGAGVFKRDHADVFWRMDSGEPPLFDDVSVGSVGLIEFETAFVRVGLSQCECFIYCDDEALADCFRSAFDAGFPGVVLRGKRFTRRKYEVRTGADGSCSVISEGLMIGSRLSVDAAAGVVMQSLGDMLCSWACGSVLAVHAAAVRFENNRIALIMGPSGSGKSSLAVALSKYGYLMGDECVFVDTSTGSAWCEDWPVQIKERNSLVLARADLSLALRVEGGSSGPAYCIPRNQFGADSDPLKKGSIACVVLPSFDEYGPAAELASLRNNKLVGWILGSAIGDCVPSVVLSRFVRMLSTRAISVRSLTFSNVDTAAALVESFVSEADDLV